jgi:hypothetical protein
MLALHGDAHEAVELGLTQLLAFRRAGDTARVRGIVRMVIPALHRLVQPSQSLDLAVLHGGTADRPHVKEPFLDHAVTDVVAQIAGGAGADAVAQAASRGSRMPDQDVFELAVNIIQTAVDRPGRSQAPVP